MAELKYDETGRLLFTEERKGNIPFLFRKCYLFTLP